MLKGKIILITGASSGIGEACAYEFAKAGCDLILTARRIDILKSLSQKLREEFNTETHIAELDVRKYENIKNFVHSLPEKWKKIDILINNAGLAKGLNLFVDDDPGNWDEMLDTNVKGVLNVTHNILPLMIENGAGHIINLGSIAGHEAYMKGSVYCATKHGLDAITRSIRAELVDKNIRVSTVDPGMVETNFSNIRFNGDEERAKNVYKGLVPLTGQDIAEAVLFCANRPPHCNINEMVIMPSVQASATVVFRK